jgi:hypothetical protein
LASFTADIIYVARVRDVPGTDGRC